jgi:hypothetical protein
MIEVANITLPTLETDRPEKGMYATTILTKNRVNLRYHYASDQDLRFT